MNMDQNNKGTYRNENRMDCVMVCLCIALQVSQRDTNRVNVTIKNLKQGESMSFSYPNTSTIYQIKLMIIRTNKVRSR